MELKRFPIANVIIEVFSVILGVLAALAVNEWRTTINNKDMGFAAYEKIVMEVERNRNKVDELLLNHMTILVEIDSIIDKLERNNEELSINQINFETPSSTAWEAAKLITAVNYLEYDIVEKITSVYSTQKVYSDVSDRVFQELVFFVPNNNREEMKTQFIKQKVYLYNLISIEEQLIEEYKKFLKET